MRTPLSHTVTLHSLASITKTIANPPSPPPMMTTCFISRIEDRGSRIENRESTSANGAIHYPLSTILKVSPAFPVDAPAALAAQPRGEADGEQDRFGQRVQQD